MELAENIFCTDSQAYMNALSSGSMRHDENSRWLFAIASIDHFLDDFQLETEERKNLLLGLNRSFGKEFGKGKQLARQLSDKYRTHRSRISQLLSAGNDEPLFSPLRERSILSKQSVRCILGMYDNKQMEVDKLSLLSYLIHMSMNRIFQNNNRLHEMVIYDFLFRYYKSLVMFQVTEN
jgi:thiopeptide-type bacteriocin biosynthesis protein